MDTQVRNRISRLETDTSSSDPEPDRRSRTGRPPLAAFGSVLLIVLAACGGQAPAPAPFPRAGSCCDEFNYVLEATIFNIDVVHLNLQVDAETAATLASLTENGRRTPDKEDIAAGALLATTSARARMTFLVRIPADQFLDETETLIRGLGSEGLLQSPQVESLVLDARRRFAFLEGSGIAAGDYLEQHLRGDSVTTTYVSGKGEQRLRGTRVGSEHRAAMLGSYFARSSSFREGLLDIVFGGE